MDFKASSENTEGQLVHITSTLEQFKHNATAAPFPGGGALGSNSGESRAESSPTDGGEFRRSGRELFGHAAWSCATNGGHK